jgi:hypothetical protein
MQPVSKPPIFKHVSAAMNTHTTIQLLLETVFSARSVQTGYKKNNWGDLLISREEAGSNTSTVALRVIGGDKKRSLESESKIWT